MEGIDESRVINGVFGRIELDGEWMSSFTACSIKEEYEYADIKLPGTRYAKHKLTGIKVDGSLTGYEVTSQLKQALLEDPTRTFTIVTNLEDPESYGAERVKASKVKFTSNPLVNFKVGDVVEDEWPFVVDEKPEFVDTIEKG